MVPKANHTAVRRNRLKRQLRELVRLRLLRVLPPLDVVIRAGRHTYDASFAVLGDEVERVRATLARPLGTA